MAGSAVDSADEPEIREHFSEGAGAGSGLQE